MATRRPMAQTPRNAGPASAGIWGSPYPLTRVHTAQKRCPGPCAPHARAGTLRTIPHSPTRPFLPYCLSKTCVLEYSSPSIAPLVVMVNVLPPFETFIVVDSTTLSLIL